MDLKVANRYFAIFTREKGITNLRTEACAAVGHSVSMPPLKFEIVCFCPC